MPIATTNPATGEVLKTYDPMSHEQIDAAIGRADAAFTALRATGFAERAGWMRAAADLLDKEQDEIARTMTTEMGKTLAAARAEAAKCAKSMRWYAEHAEQLLADEHPDAADVRTAARTAPTCATGRWAWCSR